ncbi:MAG TPA: ABC transporter permease, partial [Vicinamibacterales bacterium]|nr:ABC transporter permease [Vicinamibacterales bacterium]
MLSDLRFAIRTLLHSRGFTATALVILTLGIGATTTMFSATYAVLVKPLPYPDPARIFVVRETRAQAQLAVTVMSAREYLAWTRNSRVLRDATLVSYPGLAVAIEQSPERLPALSVSAEFFALFGAQPIAGRAFGRDAEQPGRGDVVLITHRMWQDRFGGAADVIGRTIRVDGRPSIILGILPPRFAWSGRVDLVVPMTFSPDIVKDTAHSFDVYARLAPNVTRERAVADLSRVALADPGSTAHATGVTLIPLRTEVVGESETPMLVLFGAVGFVLLIACANIANLLLARGAARQ